MMYISHKEDAFFRTLLKEARICEVMKKPVVTISEDEDLTTAEEMFIKDDVKHLPVVDRDKKLIGLITQKDLDKAKSVRKFVDGRMQYDRQQFKNNENPELAGTFAPYDLENVMVKNPFTRGFQNRVSEVIIDMARKEISCIPIINESNHVCGIVTRTDIVNIDAKILEGK